MRSKSLRAMLTSQTAAGIRGTGIYRPAYLHVGEEKYIPVNGVKIRTLSYDPAKIEVVVKTSSPGEVSPED